MKKSFWVWQALGFGVISFCGTLLHFAYGWSGRSGFVAPFAAVNESTWEHMKLYFWPALIYAAFLYFFLRRPNGFWCIKAKGIFAGLALIPTLFYTLSGIFGTLPDLVNIAIFFIAIFLALACETRLAQQNSTACAPWVPFAVLITLAIAFVLFTFWPPTINLFVSPARLP